jgi:hypothetical protein
MTAYSGNISFIKAETKILRSIVFLIWFLFSILFVSSCQKEQQPLIFDEDYLKVADILHNCQGSCDEILDWENNEAVVFGHIMDIENDSIKKEYFSKSKFYLLDIRNGMFMEVSITENKDPIFEKIWNAKKTDEFLIKGTLNAVYAFDNDECVKGVNLLLNHPDNINFK